MAIAMVALLAFGGTYAYFTATAQGAAGTATTALIKLTNNTATIETKTNNALPGEQIFQQDIELVNGSTRDTYIFAKIEVKFGDTAVALDDASKLTIAAISGWTETSTTGTYSVEAAATTNKTITIDIKLAEDLDENNMQGTADDAHDYMNKAVTVTVKFAAVQKDGFANADEALAEAEFEYVAG